MSLDLALGIARSGLAAVQRSLAQASQNLANAQTPGYVRKTVEQRSLVVADMPAGLRSGDTQRVVDLALLGRLDQSRGAAAAAAVREDLLSRIEQAHGATADGATLGDAVAALSTAFTALRGAPADAGQQRAALAAAGTVASRLNDVAAAIGAARQDAQDGIVAEIAAANAALRQIAGLTVQIKSGTGGDQAGLEDQRDQAIAELSQGLEVQALRRPDGDLLLIARGGLVLPLDPSRDLLATAPASVGPDAFHGSGGTLPGITLNGVDVTGQVAGGRLGAYVAMRDHILPRYQAETDLVAAQLASRLDQQGLRLFTDSDGSSVPDTALPYAGSAQIGFAGRIRLGSLVSADPSLLRDGTHAVTPTSGGPDGFVPNPPSGPAGFTTLLDRVLTFSLGAEASQGNPWPPIQGAGLGPDGMLASPFTPASRIVDYASAVTAAQLGDRAAATEARSEAAGMQKALNDRFTATSGVDVDAEMGGMVALQNAYAANAKVISTLQAMWDSLLGAMR